MAITINGTSIVQPTLVKEELVQIQTENTALDGSVARYRYGQKKQATLGFVDVSPSDYQTLVSLFTTGSGVYYLNTLSNYTGSTFSFSGLPYFSEDVYLPGASLYRPFNVRIREL